MFGKSIMIGVSCLCLAAQGGAHTPYRQLRALWDMSGFPYADLAATTSPWLLLKIQPDPDSGMTSGMHINAETGELVREPGAKTEIVTKGTVRQLSRFDGVAVDQGPQTYSWGTAIVSRTRSLHRLLYSPFVSGGTVLSQYWGPAPLETKYDPYYLVEDGWSDTLAAYAAARKTGGTDWLKLENVQDRRRLRAQLSGDNPFLALLAFRALRASGSLKDDPAGYVSPGVAELVRVASPSFQPLLILDALRSAPTSADVVGGIKQWTDNARGIADLKPVALAARSILDFGAGTETDELRTLSRELLQRCAAGSKRISGDVSAQSELQQIIAP